MLIKFIKILNMTRNLARLFDSKEIHSLFDLAIRSLIEWVVYNTILRKNLIMPSNFYFMMLSLKLSIYIV